jgi:hypothetical protein
MIVVKLVQDIKHIIDILRELRKLISLIVKIVQRTNIEIKWGRPDSCMS